MELLIKGARIIDFSQDFVGDVYVKDGIISEIGMDLNKNCKTINREGYILLPSFIDTHAHFRDPGLTYKEDMESGSRAAVRGGYTVVNLMANTKPICSNMKIINYVKEKANNIGLIEVNQVASITKDFDGKDISHINKLDSTVKIISEDGKDVMDSNVMLSAMKNAKEKGITVMCHSENHELSSIDMRLAENTMTWRNISLAEFTGCKIHVAHVSTKEAMQYVIDAKRKGYNVTCEVTPHHIALTTKESNYRVNPPIREKEDVEFLINAIQKGYVDAIGTDHAPHTKEDKENGAPGLTGLETSFSVCYTKLVKEGYINLCKLSEIMSKGPGEILGFKKGQIKIGFHGDFTIVDLNKEYTVNPEGFCSKGKNTPFEGKKLWGQIIETYRKGKLVYDIQEEKK